MNRYWILFFLVWTVIIVMCFFTCSRWNQPTTIEKITIKETRDTVYYTDTVFYDKPLLVWRKQIDSVFIPYYVSVIDSFIDLQKQQAYYMDSGKYEAWVSGYEPALDSIRLYDKYTEITHTIEIEKTITHIQKYGLLFGAGLSCNFNVRIGFSPYIGAEIKNHNVLIGYDVINKEAQILYLYKFWKK
ncbi:MAG: hypothetical protein FWC41_12215 [Firmicutes bacterium]|nr:hypothetical protein [Bacillota bacterium]